MNAKISSQCGGAGASNSALHGTAPLTCQKLKALGTNVFASEAVNVSHSAAAAVGRLAVGGYDSTNDTSPHTSNRLAVGPRKRTRTPFPIRG
jgi:hypothetical protein